MSTEEKKYPIGGYAPGNYYGKCITCKQEYKGEKYSYQCEPCAVKDKEWFDALSPEEQQAHIDANAAIARQFFDDLNKQQ